MKKLAPLCDLMGWLAFSSLEVGAPRHDMKSTRNDYDNLAASVRLNVTKDVHPIESLRPLQTQIVFWFSRNGNISSQLFLTYNWQHYSARKLKALLYLLDNPCVCSICHRCRRRKNALY